MNPTTGLALGPELGSVVTNNFGVKVSFFFKIK